MPSRRALHLTHLTCAELRLSASAASAQAARAGTSVLAGTSVALAVTLRARFPGEFCAYCAASIVASLTLYLTTFFSSTQRRKSWSFASVCATALAVLGLYTTYPPTVTAGAKQRVLCDRLAFSAV